MSNTSASPTPDPTPSTVKYATILDAGSTSTRIYVYSWGANHTDPLCDLKKVYESDNKAIEKGKSNPLPKEFHRLTQEQVADYLNPLLNGTSKFLTEGTNPRVKSGVDKVPIYLLATGGMRTLSKKAQDTLLEEAYKVMRNEMVFALESRANNVRVISGKTEGILGWVALNYRDPPFEGYTTQGLFEVGGASMQLAYRTGGSQANEKICLNGDKAGTTIYSETWDGFGADAVLGELHNIIWNDAMQAGNSGPVTVGNPCLPRGAPDGHLHGIIGTGDFPTCLALAKRILLEGAKGRSPMPYYPFIQTDSPLFVGISSPSYTYDFFSNALGAGYDVSEPYNRRLFEASALKYCSGFFDGKVTDYSHTLCFKAAWMLTLLHDAENGFGMTKVDVLKGRLRFPVGEKMKQCSSWTCGAAVLIASHGGIIGCEGAAPLSVGDNEKGSTFGYVPQPIIAPVEQPYPSYPQIISTPFTNSLIAADRSASFDSPHSSASIINIAGFATILLVIWIFLYRRLRASRPISRKVNPSEVKHFIL